MKRLGCAAVLGHLFPGIAIGPFGLRLFHAPAAAHQRAHFGVVLRLFRIGLKRPPSRLWARRRAICGMGRAQLVQPAADGPGVGRRAEPAGGGLALSSTAFVLQLMVESHELARPHGRASFAASHFSGYCRHPPERVGAVAGDAQRTGGANPAADPR